MMEFLLGVAVGAVLMFAFITALLLASVRAEIRRMNAEIASLNSADAVRIRTVKS